MYTCTWTSRSHLDAGEHTHRVCNIDHQVYVGFGSGNGQGNTPLVRWEFAWNIHQHLYQSLSPGSTVHIHEYLTYAHVNSKELNTTGNYSLHKLNCHLLNLIEIQCTLMASLQLKLILRVEICKCPRYAFKGMEYLMFFVDWENSGWLNFFELQRNSGNEGSMKHSAGLVNTFLSKKIGKSISRWLWDLFFWNCSREMGKFA